jgi:hypothetical protein
MRISLDLGKYKTMNSASITDKTLEKDTADAMRTINDAKSRDILLDLYQRLQQPKYQHISHLADKCLEKIIEKGFLNGNYTRLPAPLPQDIERVNLHHSWLMVIALTNICNIATLNSVVGKGYLQAMLNQIDDIKNIGGAGFKRLKEDSLLHYSAEYLMRKHYSDRLRPEQIAAIDELLAQNNVSLETA